MRLPVAHWARINDRGADDPTDGVTEGTRTPLVPLGLCGISNHLRCAASNSVPLNLDAAFVLAEYFHFRSFRSLFTQTTRPKDADTLHHIEK